MRYEVPAIEDLGSIAEHTFMPAPARGLSLCRWIFDLLGIAGFSWEYRGHSPYGSVPS